MCSIEKFKDKLVPTRKFEETEECQRWRNLTQTEMSDQWKELCKEIEDQVLDKYGVEESNEVSSRSGPSRKSITSI